MFDNTGLVVADSRVREGAGGAVVTEPLPPQAPRGAFSAGLATLYDRLVALVPRGTGGGRGADLVVDVKPDAPAFDWQPDLGPDRREELRLALEGGVTPYIRRTGDGQLLVSVAEPARRGNQPVGIVLLTREAREVDQRLFEIRASVLGIFAVALVLTVLLSFYLAQTLASPIMQLAGSAAAMRQGEGRTGSVPLSLLSREDEIGILARDLQRAARDLWARIDTNERFAADVAHELRNPLTSVRSAIETLRRIENPEQQTAAARHHRRGRGADGPPDRRHQRQLAGGCRVVADRRGAGGRGAHPLDLGGAAHGDAGRGHTGGACWRRRRPAWWCAAWRGGWCRCSATCSATRSPSARATAPCA